MSEKTITSFICIVLGLLFIAIPILFNDISYYEGGIASNSEMYIRGAYSQLSFIILLVGFFILGGGLAIFIQKDELKEK